jgi:hypothetical protein
MEEPNEGKKRFLFCQIVGHGGTQWGEKKGFLFYQIVGHEPNEGKIKDFFFVK